MRRNNCLRSSLPSPFLEMHSGPGRGFPVVYVVGRDEMRHRALQPHRLVQGARAARPGRMGAPRGPRAHQAGLGRAGADTALSGFRHPPLGVGRGLWRLQSSESGHHLGRFRSHRRASMSNSSCSRPWGRSTTAISQAWECGIPSSRNGAGSRPPPVSARATSMSTTKCRPQPLQTSNRNGLRFVGSARLHHPAIYVARRLAQLRRLQRPESE